MTTFNTEKAEKKQELLGMLEKPPAGQKSNWENNLIPYFVNRLKEWNGGVIEDDLSRNYQYANLLIKNKFLREFVLMRHLPFPIDMAKALECTLTAGEECEENRKQMTNFYFIYKNFEKIMKKIPCLKTANGAIKK